ncbi:MAG: hypothetical protein E7354_02305 [Clostridiales bacterium]|nr:hypothetical protein [Clostridiales bacterium]
MAKFKPNEEQEQFLKTNDCNVLVSASAGSGKTSTMIQKLLMLLNKYKFPISSLLVVTFTNAAAAEIRQRLYIAISNLLPTLKNNEDKEYFKKQLENIGNAEIGTLHSICKKLIVKYFYVIEQSPDFNLITDRETDYLFDSAIQSVFKKHIVEKDDDFFDLFNSYNSDRSDSNLKQLIKQLHNFAGSKSNYIEWRESTSNNSYNLDLDHNIACEYIIEQYKQKFFGMMTTLDDLLNEASVFALDKHSEFIVAWKQFIDEFGNSTSFSQALKIYNNFTAPRKPNKLKKATPEEQVFEGNLEYVKEILKTIQTNLKKEFIFTEYDKIQEGITQAKNNLTKIITLSDEIESAYIKLKKEKNALDFNDLETIMLQILEDKNVRDELKNHYKFIFFDEYQDINEKQELILSKLTSGDNYYMIGDVKQSIYAFRQASPKIFIAKFQQFLKDGVGNKLITFNKNYRSELNILEYANQVFDYLITEDTIGIDYKATARFESEKNPDCGRVKLSILDSFESENNRVEAEALMVAREIVSLMQKKKIDGTKFDYRDIAIIMRSRGDLAYTLYNTLSSLQIPVTTEIDTDFFESNEIKVLVSILKVLSNYRDDLSMATALKVLFGFTEDELIQIREQSSKKFYYEAVFEYNANDNIFAKIKEFLNFLQYYKQYQTNHTLAEMIWDIVEKYSLILFYKSLPKGMERENNIFEFIAFADNDNYKYNLDKFLEYIDFVAQKSLKQTIGAQGNSVQICTIHHSKGLEYPAVILCGLGRQIRTNQDSSNIVINNTFGLGIKSIDIEERTATETIIRKASKLDNAKSEFDEEIRLLYVAMTRPREYLTLMGTYDLSKLEINHKSPIYSSSSMLDMILKTYSQTDVKKIAGGKNIILNENEPNQSNIEIIKIDEVETSSQNEKGEVIVSGADSKLVQSLQSLYQNKPSKETFTIKNTVTNILREEVDYENIISVPKSLNITDKVDGVDSLKLGTAYHTVMQRVNFNESAEDIEALISGLISEGELDSSLKNSIKVDEIVEACKIVGALIKDAKAVYREKQFLMCENYNKLVKNSDNKTKVVVQGVIDLVIELEKDAILIDYKTNRTTNIQMLKDEYSLQLEIYKRAFELAKNIKISKKYIYSFYLKTLIEVE